MAIKTEQEYLDMANDLSEGKSCYGVKCILNSLVNDHPDPAVTSAKFEWLKQTTTNEGTFDEACIVLNTGEKRSAIGSEKKQAAAKAAAAFSS